MCIRDSFCALLRVIKAIIAVTAKAANMPAAVTAAIVICFFSLFSVIIASLKADVLSSYNVCIPICEHKTTSLIIT